LALCSGLFAILHPEQDSLGRKALSLLGATTIQDPDNLAGAIENWPAPFSGISVISNRETPIHQDTGGQCAWYDLLVTVGEYNNGRFELPGVDI
jgi:hypothetical protein